MSGRTSTDDDVLRHQQARDLGHDIEKQGGADRARASFTGSGTIEEDTGKHEPDMTGIDERRRKKPSQ